VGEGINDGVEDIPVLMREYYRIGGGGGVRIARYSSIMGGTIIQNWWGVFREGGGMGRDSRVGRGGGIPALVGGI
jgi:hypothetical protein